MTRKCRCILKECKKLCAPSDYIFGRNIHGQLCDLEVNNTFDINHYCNDSLAIFDYLIANGYIKEIEKDDLYQITYKGLHPVAFAYDEIRGILLKSIVAPILVSIITTLIINRFLR